LVRLDGKVDPKIVEKILAISSITEAKLVRLPESPEHDSMEAPR